jgi:hypothetical protein
VLLAWPLHLSCHVDIAPTSAVAYGAANALQPVIKGSYGVTVRCIVLRNGIELKSFLSRPIFFYYPVIKLVPLLALTRLYVCNLACLTKLK